jgi:UPF0716 protein FxsA
MKILFLLFIIMPIVEMTVLIKVGSVIGAPSTIGLVLLTAIIGASLLKRQGLSTLMRANQKMNAGELPAKEVAEGFLLAVGGALLLTPGFVTDAIGFSLLMPGIRGLMIEQLMKKMMVAGARQFTQSSSFDHSGFGPSGFDSSAFGRGTRSNDEDVIEGEFYEEGKPSSSAHSINTDSIEKK